MRSSLGERARRTLLRSRWLANPEEIMSYPRVHITEQLMREGMQIESAQISVEDKIRLINGLSTCGLDRIVVGSFVRAEYCRQMAQIDRLVEQLTPMPGVRYTALALNPKGAQRRAVHMPPLVAEDWPPMLSCHMCDTFVRRNANRSQQHEIDGWPAIVEEAVVDRAPVAAIGVNAAFGSNFSGFFPLAERMSMLRQQHRMWDAVEIPVTHVMIGDPMGWVMPHWVEQQITALRREWPGISHFHMHLHNSRGLALAST
jgi:hydroxymethylglutaryl-CoA lyase